MTTPKILTFDIETKPNLVYTFSLRKAYIGVEQIVEPSRIISVGAKWLGQKRVMYWDVFARDPKKARAETLRMLKATHALLSEADAVVGKNSDRFDLVKLRGEFAKEKLPPLPPTTSIDLETTLRKMGLPTTKLAFAAPYFGEERKRQHDGFTLWRQYMDGRTAARKEMRLYCKQDVIATEAMYIDLRPYIESHPYLDDDTTGACPNCGSHKVIRQGYKRTRVYRIARLQCQSCGAWHQGTRSKV